MDAGAGGELLLVGCLSAPVSRETAGTEIKQGTSGIRELKSAALLWPVQVVVLSHCHDGSPSPSSGKREPDSQGGSSPWGHSSLVFDLEKSQGLDGIPPAFPGGCSQGK